MSEQLELSLPIDQQRVFDMLPIHPETRAKLYLALMNERKFIVPRGVVQDQDSQQTESGSLDTNSESSFETDSKTSEI